MPEAPSREAPQSPALSSTNTLTRKIGAIVEKLRESKCCHCHSVDKRKVSKIGNHTKVRQLANIELYT
ncbi:unnamed protein product [Coffea canephora]|uniref:Uncharacterized protein n=1 Tax=Coffea canephora TaxID=49390 RepID=A0A068USK8_COFCA|nr:unnamed protein product [Coffea canephora]